MRPSGRGNNETGTANPNRNGKLHKGRTGAARLAMAIGCPIYPVGIVGTDAIQPPDAKMPKLRKSCSITIGRPIKPERYANRGAEHLVPAKPEPLFAQGVHRARGKSARLASLDHLWPGRDFVDQRGKD